MILGCHFRDSRYKVEKFARCVAENTRSCLALQGDLNTEVNKLVRNGPYSLGSYDRWNSSERVGIA